MIDLPSRVPLPASVLPPPADGACRPRRWGEAGSAATELVGLLVVVALVLGLGATALAGARPDVVAGARAKVCEVLGQDGCDDAAPPDGRLVREDPARLTAGTVEVPQDGRDPGATGPVRSRSLVWERAPDVGPAPVAAAAGDQAALAGGDDVSAWCGPATVHDWDDATQTERAVCADAAGAVRECSRGRFSYWGVLWSSWGPWHCHAGGLAATDLACQEAGVPGADVLCRLASDADRLVRCSAVLDGVHAGRFACRYPDLDPAGTGTPYPGPDRCTPARDLGYWSGYDRACLGENGTLYHCGAHHAWFGGVDDAGWSCGSRTVPADLVPEGACASTAPESAVCEVAGELLRCFQPSVGSSAGQLVHCRVLDPGDPLSAAVTVGDEQCEAAVTIEPALTAQADAHLGPLPADPAVVEAQLQQVVADTASAVQAVTGYDITDAAQRAELLGAFEDLKVSLDTQATPGSWAQADAVFDAVAGDGHPDDLANTGRRLAALGPCYRFSKNFVLGAAVGLAVNGFVISQSPPGTVGAVTGPIGLTAAVVTWVATTLVELYEASVAADGAAVQRQQLLQGLRIVMAYQAQLRQEMEDRLAAGGQPAADADLELGRHVHAMEVDAAQHATWWQQGLDAVRWVFGWGRAPAD